MDEIQITVDELAQEFERHQRPAILQLAQLRKINEVQAAQITELTARVNELEGELRRLQIDSDLSPEARAIATSAKTIIDK